MLKVNVTGIDGQEVRNSSAMNIPTTVWGLFISITFEKRQILFLWKRIRGQAWEKRLNDESKVEIQFWEVEMSRFWHAMPVFCASVSVQLLLAFSQALNECDKVLCHWLFAIILQVHNGKKRKKSSSSHIFSHVRPESSSSYVDTVSLQNIYKKFCHYEWLHDRRNMFFDFGVNCAFIC